MTTQTVTPPTTVAVRPVSFGRVIRSEWVKFWSLRSTYWALGLTVVAMVFMSAMMGLAASMSASNPDFGEGPDGAVVIGIGYAMAQLVVAVLGVLAMTGEYSTGMIRSSLAAVPSRVPVLLAKALVIALVSFVVGVVGVVISYLVTIPMLSNAGGAADLGDPDVLRLFWGTGLYLMGVGVFGLAVGALLRHSAGAIAAVLGVLLLMPMIVQMLGGWVEWLRDIAPYLPPTAGERIVALEVPGVDMAAMGGPTLLEPWVGFGVFMIYVVVALLAAALLLRRRDA